MSDFNCPYRLSAPRAAHRNKEINKLNEFKTNQAVPGQKKDVSSLHRFMIEAPSLFLSNATVDITMLITYNVTDTISTCRRESLGTWVNFR